MLIKPKTAESHPIKADVEDRLETLRGLGYRVKPYRQGYRAYKPYFGKWWLHILLLLATRGIGNAIYLVACLRGKRTQCIYIRQV